MYAAAYQTAVARTFISLGMADKIVNVIVDKQDYYTPHTCARPDKKGVELLVHAICKPRGIMSGTQYPGINVPLWSKEIIAGEYFALKH